MSWDWRLRVAVEMTTGVSFVHDQRIEGTRYASDFDP